MAATTLTVNSPDGRYDLVFSPGLLARLENEAATYGLERRVAVVTNTTLAPLYGEALARALPDATLVTMPDGEPYKTLDTVRDLYGQFVRAGLDRGSVIVALGGGVVGDTAGFAAASYMRGIGLVQMPTSLLAMVDSSVGGKVGVDLPEGKNLVGAFKQPQHVLIDTTVLATLPPRELRCGLAEMLKHGLIADRDLLNDIVILHDEGLTEEMYLEQLAALIPRAVQVKIDLVQADPYEANVRAYLNLGHTFGHAIEQVSGYQWPHGEAVGVGLVAAARLSAHLSLCEAELAEHVEMAVGTVGLPTRMGALDPEAVFAAMATDKKWRGGRNRFVLLEAIGKPRIVEGVGEGDVMAVLERIR